MSTWMKITRVVGIDCGKSGAVAVIDLEGHAIDAFKMPVLKAGKGMEYDIDTLHDEFRYWVGHSFFAIEDPGKHAPSASGLYSMTAGFYVVKTILMTLRARHDIFQAREWQKTFWTKPKMAKGAKFDTKAAAYLAARKLWPDRDFTASERSTKNHDGIIDAFLIAEHARRKMKLGS